MKLNVAPSPEWSRVESLISHARMTAANLRHQCEEIEGALVLLGEEPMTAAEPVAGPKGEIHAFRIDGGAAKAVAAEDGSTPASALPESLAEYLALLQAIDALPGNEHGPFPDPNYKSELREVARAKAFAAVGYHGPLLG